jgi:hypothetical protein
MDANTSSNEYLNIFIKHTGNNFLNLTSLIAFIGGRHVISDFYDHRPDILCNPFVKIIVLFSIIYMNVRHINSSILLFFIYILFIDNYITNNCSLEYLETTKDTQSSKLQL